MWSNIIFFPSLERIGKRFSLYYILLYCARSGAAAVDFFAGAEPIIGLEFVIMLATARELTQPRALRSHYLDHDGCSAVQCHALPPQW